MIILTDDRGETAFYVELGRLLSTEVLPGDVLGLLGMGGYDYQLVIVDAIWTRLADRALVFGLDWRGYPPLLWPDSIVPDRSCKLVHRQATEVRNGR